MRDTYKYLLKDFLGNILYVGITNDLERRKSEHLREGMKFASMEQVGYITTHDAASEWEEETIKEFKRLHGYLPVYNQNDTGK